MNLDSLTKLEPYQAHYIRRLLKAPIRDLNSIINASHDSIKEAFDGANFDVIKFLQDYIDEFKALSIERIFNALEMESKLNTSSQDYLGSLEKAHVPIEPEVSISSAQELEQYRNLLESSFALPAFKGNSENARSYSDDRLDARDASSKFGADNSLQAIVRDIIATESLKEFSYKEIEGKVRKVHPNIQLNTVVLGSLIRNQLGYKSKRVRRGNSYINVYYK